MSGSDPQKVVLIGKNVSASRSPAFLNALFHTYDLPLHYELRATEPRELGNVVRHIAVSGLFRGANVTAPYKEMVVQYLDGLSEMARRLQAVNTISVERGRAYGHNTDVAGIRSALDSLANGAVIERAAILGTGGAAAAGVEVLLAMPDIRHVQIVSRSLERAKQFAQRWRDERVEPIEYESFLGAEMLVNATPVGSSSLQGMPVQKEILCGTRFLYDMIYTPAETELMKAGRSLGALVANGVSMLEAQALESFRIWTGIDPTTAPPPRD